MPKAKTSPKKKTIKKATKPKKKGKAKKIDWNPSKELTLAEELFCRYYVLNEETRRNGTMSYNLAFEKKLDEQPQDDAVYTMVPSKTEGMPAERVLVQASSYDRCHRVCSTMASKLLTKANISRRITELLNELLKDDFVDGELAKVIAQDSELKPKVAAIGEYNKLRKRTTTTVIEHTHSFAKFDAMTDEELEKALRDGEKFFKKK